MQCSGRDSSLDDQRKSFNMNGWKWPVSNKSVRASPKYSSSHFYNFWIFPTSFSPRLVFVVQKLFLKIFYLLIHERHREKGRDMAEGEAGSLRGTGCGTQFQDPGTMTWAKGSHSTTEPPRYPFLIIFHYEIKSFVMKSVSESKFYWLPFWGVI